MLGCTFTSVFIVNAEVDSMGEVFEGGVGILNQTSPRQAAIDKVQATLRQEYDVREERKKELEFLEKGGNLLEFNLGTVASVSAQSTSFTDQHPDQFVTSEARCSLAFTACHRGDSAESSDRPWAPPYEPNSAANLLLHDAELECSENDQNPLHFNRNDIVPSLQLSQRDGSQKAREHADSAGFGLPRKSYKRRYRSRTNQNGTRSSSTDVNPTHGSHSSSLPSCNDLRGLKVSTCEAKSQNLISNNNSNHVGSVDGTCQKTVSSYCNQEMEFDGVKAVESTNVLIECVSVDPLDEKLNQQPPPDGAIRIDYNGVEATQLIEEMTSAVVEFHPSLLATKVENHSNSSQVNGFLSRKGDGIIDGDHRNSALRGIRILDSVSSCTQSILNTDGINDKENCTKIENVDLNVNNRSLTLELEGGPDIEDGEYVNGKKESSGIDSTLVNKEINSSSQIQVEDGFSFQHEEYINQSESTLKTEVEDHIINEGKEDCGPTRSESERKPTHSLIEIPCPKSEIGFDVRHQVAISNIHEAELLTRGPNVSPDAQNSVSDLVDKIDEDSILKEALIIEAKRKRIAELSITTSPMKIRRISRWDYVLEEMAWLANDFAQERIWKIAAAAQISYRVASTCRLRKQGKSSSAAVKEVAHTMAKAVVEFWQERSKELEQQSEKDGTLAIHAYASRILKYNNSYCHDQAEMPQTPDRFSDSGILDLSWEDNLSDDNFFYRIPFGAMETYRKSIENHVAKCERTGRGARDQEETSACDTTEEFNSQDYECDEDAGEPSTRENSMFFDVSNSARFVQKKRKYLTNAYGPRPYEIGSDLVPMQCADSKVEIQQSSLLEKRPGSSLNVSIPTKRVRTASRRIISPFSVGTSGFIQALNKTDASSGDTNSFQDEQSTLRGGLLNPNSLEVESVGEFGKQPFDSAEVSTKHKINKKAKHLNVAYEQRWQVDPNFQEEQFQMDRFKRSSEGHQSESNGNNGFLGHPTIKKAKVMRQSQDNSFDNITPIGGSIPSPVASQMSNMANPNKIIKMLGSRERGRKSKVLKVPAAHLGSGNPWSLFEDQALVVLAHDLGPNWELVSDAINSALHFKCIFRKAKECKERHHFLMMDKTSADGLDSAEDSGSSQPYRSTLPGIPKGSARQLFQRLQGPLEEDTIKSHFEKIIILRQKQHYRKTQDPKQLQQPHSSHHIALSQACPNNLNGRPILTPLELCEATTPDILPLGYQGQYSSGLAIANQGAVTPILPASGANSASQGSANMMLGYNLSSPPGPLNSSGRAASLSADEQKRIHHYNHMISGRNTLQPKVSSPGALPGTDRGVQINPGGNAVSMMSGINRSTPMARPGLQGIGSSSMVNSGSLVSPGMPQVNLHSAVGSGQGNSILRPREALHMMRPALIQDSQRQLLGPDLQMPGNNQGVAHFGGSSSPFPNQTASPPISAYPVHHQLSPQPPQVLTQHHPQFHGPANHAPNPQQQAYAIRLAKERQLQHRFLQQQPQQFASNSLVPHVNSQPQLPISSPMQNSSQVKPQTNSPPASSMNSVPQQKNPTPSQGVVRNMQAGGSGLANKSSKQRKKQQQQFLQASRQHPQQSQAQQQAKIVKGAGRGNVMMHQNIPNDPSLINGVSKNPGNKCSGKGESAAHSTQSQGLYTGSRLHDVQPTKQYVSSQSSNQSLPQQKLYSCQASSSVPRHAHPENSSQVHVPPVHSPARSAGHWSDPSCAKAGLNHQQAQSNQNLVNQSQLGLHSVAQTSLKIISEPSNKPQTREPDGYQHPTSSSDEIDKVATLPESVTNANVCVQADSTTSAQWHASEQLLNINSAVSSLVSTPSSLNDSVPQADQGPGQVSSSADVAPVMHDISAQWSHSPVPQPLSPVPKKQQQPLPALHSHVQEQLLQEGKGNLYSRPTDPRLE